jgi:hypothetical protein
MEIQLEEHSEALEPLQRYLRPSAIFLGLGTFLLGAIVLGSALAAARPAHVELYLGPLVLLLGVGLVGGAFLMEPSDHWLDPEVAFEGLRRYFVATVSTASVLLAAAIALFG